jgi:integrase
VPEHPRLSEALARYQAMRRARYAAPTTKNENFVLSRFLDWYGEDVQVRHLRASRVEEWFHGSDGLRAPHVTRDGVEREPIQESTYNFYRSRLKSFFAFCNTNGWLKNDPLVHVTPMPVTRKKRLQPMPRVLLGMLDATENPRDRAYLATAINTALRASEINRLRVGDVDLNAGDLKVWISKSREEDLMPISSDLDAELRRWLTTYGVDMDRPLSDEDYLFPDRKNSVYAWTRDEAGAMRQGRTSPSWQPDKTIQKPQEVVQAALAAMNMPTKHEGVHTVRRAVARAYFDSLAVSGYDSALRQTSALLHHKNSTTTEHYLGLASEREQRDKTLKGKPFLTAMVSDQNVGPLRRAGTAN